MIKEDTAILLPDKKVKKQQDNLDDRIVFQEAGFVYLTNTFSTTADTINNILSKDRAASGIAERYKFYGRDSEGKIILANFTDDADFKAFLVAMVDEYERIMQKYNDFKKRIEDAATPAAVDAIVINYAV